MSKLFRLKPSRFRPDKVSRELKRALADITPPVLQRIGGGAASADDPESGKRDVIDLTDGNLNGRQHFQGDPLFMIPVERLCYPHALEYTDPRHPFHVYYDQGYEALKAFYEAHQPTHIFTKHYLDMPDRPGLPRSGNPWEIQVNKTDAEWGLSLDHGVQFHGPVTEEKLKLEVHRLDVVLKSIRKKGFDPSYGYPMGYFMINDAGDWRFRVTTGRHRVAAMIHLGEKTLPFLWRHNVSRVIYRSSVDYWPMVVSKQLTRDEALTLFDLYFLHRRPLHFTSPEAALAEAAE